MIDQPYQDRLAQQYQDAAWERQEALEAAGWTCATLALDGLGAWDHAKRRLRFIHSVALELDGDVWAHLSVSRFDKTMPSWANLRDTWRLIYPHEVGVVVIPPADEHVNLAEVAHAWGCLTRRPLPDFTRGGKTI